MADTIFATSRHVYDSYKDLLRLIALSGYPLVYFDEIQPDTDNTYICIVINGENERGWPHSKARIILYDLEWHTNGIPTAANFSELWAADRWYAGKIGAKYVPLGSHPGLRLGPGRAPYEYRYDVSMLAYMVWRRQVIHGQLVARGLTTAPNAHNPERHDNLIHSALMLHVHQHDGIATVAPLRFALAAAYKLPLISEDVTDCGVQNGPVYYADYHDLADVAQKARADTTWLQEYGEALHQKWCVDNTFRGMIEAAL